MPENQMRRGTGQTGVFATIDSSTQRATPQVEEMIHYIAPNENPFTFILDEIGGIEEVGNMTFYEQQEHPINRDMVVMTAQATVTEETHVLDDTSMLRKGDTCINLNTREMIQVISVTNSTTIEASRAAGGSSAVATTVGDPVVRMHIVLREASDRVQLLTRGTEFTTFWTEHSAHAIGVSEWAQIQEVRGPAELDRLTRQKLREFNTGREHSAILSQGGSDTDSTTSLKTFFQRGLWELCREHNRYSMNKMPSFDGLAAAVQHNARYSASRNLTGFASLDCLNVVNRFEELRNNYRVPQGATELKMDVREFGFPGGFTLTLIESDVLNRRYLNNMILTLDWDVLGRKRFSGLDPRTGIESLGSFRHEDQIAVNEGLFARTTWALGTIEELF